MELDKIIINYVFAFKVAFGITRSDDEFEPQTVKECQRRNDWLMWKEAIQIELSSLTKREVFGPVVHTPKSVILVGYKWVLLENEMRKIKWCDKRHYLLHKISRRDPSLIMRKFILR